MDFKHSYNELKKPKVLLHYAIGTLLLVGIFTYLMRNGLIFKPTSPWYIYAGVFYIIYVIIDRFVHGLLDLR